MSIIERPLRFDGFSGLIPGSEKDQKSGLKPLENTGLFRFVEIIPQGHTAATMMLQNGVDIKTVSGMPGCCDAGFTLRTFTHSTNRRQAEAADRMGSLAAQSL